MSCILCQKEIVDHSASLDTRVTCDICGIYDMAFELQCDRDMSGMDPGSDALKAALSAATKQANQSRRILGLTLENYYSHADAHLWTPVAQKLHKVLEVCERRSHGHFGSSFPLTPEIDYPLFDAVSPDEAEALISHVREESLILALRPNYRLTGKGWQAIEPIQGGGILGRCFVAMAFDSELDDAYYHGIKLAIIDSGYQPVCLKELEHQTNNNITDHILAEIRKAQFIGADFSMQKKGGVYFEAGFAKALGKEVFWTCRADDFKDLHFDTNHYGHIKWTTPQDLRDNLKARILAEIGKGPY